MKTIASLLTSFLIATSILAQTVSTVTINVRGNNNESISVDGKEYLVLNENTSVNTNTPIVVSNLLAGQHTLQIKRSNEINPSSTIFTIRTGYDLQITITANGSVQLRETKWRADNTTDHKVAMNATEFNTLYYSIRNQGRANTRMTLVSDAFANTNQYFTTVQVRQLVQLINGQPNRFTLLKASYRSVTDPVNFNQLNDLLTSQSYRDQLEDYVASYNAGSSSTAMSTAGFNTIYRTAQRQTTVNSKVSYIYNTFSNTNNYFTVAQATRLIQLVADEPNRLYLAKISYRSVVDKTSFWKINDLLTSQSSKYELNVFVKNFDGNTPDPVYTKVAMKDADYNTLYRDIQNRFGIGAKMAALTNAFANENYYFTTAQARKLILLVSSESNRLELAKASYDNVVDQANFSQLYDMFSSTASRNEIEVYVRDHQSDDAPIYTTPKTPMSNTTYTSLYDDVRTTWGIGAKMSRLTEIFNTETYYFTVAQAKQLIQLVSSETNRLELAKSSYGNITDPQNFNLMYDVLASQSSRNELAAYVNTYSYNK